MKNPYFSILRYSGLGVLMILSALYLHHIFIKGHPSLSNAPIPTLSDADKQWIKEHPVIRLGSGPVSAPFEFFDENGDFQGIASDIIKLITDKTGLKILVQPPMPWNATIQQIQNRDLDLIGVLAHYQEREAYLSFSIPYGRLNRTILTRVGGEPINDLKDMAGRTLGVQENTVHHQFAKNAVPELSLKTYDDFEGMLVALSEGEIDAAVANSVSSVYHARDLGLVNVKLALDTLAAEYPIHLAVRSDWPQLITIINKALADITVAQREEIFTRWTIGATRTDYTLTLQLLSLLVLVLILGLTWSFHALKQKKKLIEAEEQQRIAADAAVFASREKSLFLAMMGHEIKTPMNGVLAMIELMGKTELNTYQNGLLQTIRRSSGSLLDVVEDILEYSRIEAGQLYLENTAFDLCDIMEHVCKTLSPMANEKSVDLLLYVEPEINEKFIGDPKRIQQVLFNLIGNAIKFSSNQADTKGRVIVSAKYGRSREQKALKTHDIYFSVKDNGVGIKSSEIEKLFTPYTQASDTIAQNVGGTGLGLSIVTKLINLMDSEIKVESSLGKGSDFYFKLRFPQAFTSGQILQKNYPAMRKQAIPDHAVLLILNDKDLSNILQKYLSYDGISAIIHGDDLTIEQATNKLIQQQKKQIIVMFDERDAALDYADVRQTIRQKHDNKVRFSILSGALSTRYNPLNSDTKILYSAPLTRTNFRQHIRGLLNLDQVPEGATLQNSGVSTGHRALSGAHVLVVDDSETNRYVLTSQLRLLDVSCDVAHDGQEALRKIKSHDYSLVLSDIRMPIMDGLELAKNVRAFKNEKKHLTLIAVTANIIPDDKYRFKSVGMNDVLSKPIELEKLQQILQKWLPKKDFNHNSTQTDTQTSSLSTTGDLFCPENMTRLVGDNSYVHNSLVKKFLERCPQTLNELQDAFDQQNQDMVMLVAHRFKSAANAVGAMRIFEILNEIETLNSNSNDHENWKKSQELLLSLKHVCDETYVLLQQFLT